MCTGRLLRVSFLCSCVCICHFAEKFIRCVSGKTGLAVYAIKMVQNKLSTSLQSLSLSLQQILSMNSTDGAAHHRCGLTFGVFAPRSCTANLQAAAK